MDCIHIKGSSELTKAERDRFKKFVENEGEVSGQYIDQRLKEAECIVQYFSADALVGTAALKKPAETHRKKCFKEAKISKLEASFPLELGYVAVRTDLRGRGLSHVLVAAAMTVRNKRAVYATSELSNIEMHTALEARHFRRAGLSYPSDRKGRNLVLFLCR